MADIKGRQQARRTGSAANDTAISGRTAPATILVASRSELLQAGLAALIRQMPELSLRGTATDGPSTAKSLQAHRPDVLLLEQDLFDDVRAHYSGDHRPRLLLLSCRQHVGVQSECGKDCACGFVRGNAPLKHVRAALRTIGACSAPNIGDGYCASCPLQGSMQPQALPLSDRENDVFRRIGLGESNQQIARALDRSVKTVETHRENIKRKLGLASAAALTEAATAWRRGDPLPKGAANGSQRRAGAMRPR